MFLINKIKINNSFSEEIPKESLDVDSLNEFFLIIYKFDIHIQ